MNLVPLYVIAFAAAVGGIFSLTACLIGIAVAIAFVLAATYLKF